MFTCSICTKDCLATLDQIIAQSFSCVNVVLDYFAGSEVKVALFVVPNSDAVNAPEIANWKPTTLILYVGAGWVH